MGSLTEIERDATPQQAGKARFGVLGAISFCHGLNDMVQSLIPSIYPILKTSFHLDFGQIGLITLTYQLVASVLQPFVGLYTDRRPQPYSLPVGMACTLAGLLVLSMAPNFSILLFGAAMVGMGSSIFHPESSRIARLASGGKHGLAQSFFQLGGNLGTSLGPLLAAFVVLPNGQGSIAWFSLAALLGIVILYRVGNWRTQNLPLETGSRLADPVHGSALSNRTVVFAVTILLALIFSKYFYLASLSSYYTFYLISKFHVSVRAAQLFLFVFLGAVAAGTIIGGPIGDRFGRKLVIWCSILGVLPFTLLLPHANLFWTAVLSVFIGVIIASAFPAIVVYAQELVPGKVGMISGLFFGFVFGMGGIGAAALGRLADKTSIDFVYQLCAYLPTIGLLAFFLPDVERRTRKVRA